MKLYGLLHVCESERSAVNLRASDFRDQIAVYVGCASTLARSLRRQGLEFTLLTNDADYLKSASELAGSLHIEEIVFRTEVPSGASFYSAHFKLDVFRYLSEVDHPYVAFCDLDMVCTREMPADVAREVTLGRPMCYDISEQVTPAYGAAVIASDLQYLHGHASEGRWYGGEFIAGPPDFFRTLFSAVSSVYDGYVENIHRLHHVGDEAVTSAALELMRRDGIQLVDAGSLGCVGRYWNSDVRHDQKDVSCYLDRFLLHLPADKRFLASVAYLSEDDPNYVRLYERHLSSTRNRLIQALRRVRNALRRRTFHQ